MEIVESETMTMRFELLERDEESSSSLYSCGMAAKWQSIYNSAKLLHTFILVITVKLNFHGNIK